jgi:hypothetical protein
VSAKTGSRPNHRPLFTVFRVKLLRCELVSVSGHGFEDDDEFCRLSVLSETFGVGCEPVIGGNGDNHGHIERLTHDGVRAAIDGLTVPVGAGASSVAPTNTDDWKHVNVGVLMNGRSFG